jgi:hypothetical protein
MVVTLGIGGFPGRNPSESREEETPDKEKNSWNNKPNPYGFFYSRRISYSPQSF